jgi:GAF domain-containing protein
MSSNGLDSLGQGVSSISSATDLHSALTSLVRLAAEGANSQAASLYMLDASGTLLKPYILYGLPEAYVRGCGDVPVGTQCCGRAVQFRRPWIVSDMLHDALFVDGRAGAENSEIRAAFSVPVINAADSCIGSLACHYKRPYTPSSYDLERNRVFATLIAFAVAKYGGYVPEIRPRVRGAMVERYESTSQSESGS